MPKFTILFEEKLTKSVELNCETIGIAQEAVHLNGPMVSENAKLVRNEYVILNIREE